MSAACWSALAILVGSLATGASKGVAPWGYPDAPNPDPGLPACAPLPPDPPGLIHAEGDRASLPDGVTVQLRSVARRRSGDAYGTQTSPDGRPRWSPDGTQSLALPPQYRTLGNASYAHILGGLAGKIDGGREFDDRGARYLTFRISGPKDADLDLDGYIPELARTGEAKPEWHGRDAPRSEIVLQGAGVDYETEIVVDDRAASHYRLAIATGEWKTVATLPLDLSEFRGFPSEKIRSGKSIVARGTWGALQLDAHDYDRLRGAHGYSGPGPSVELNVVQPEPHRLATRLRFFGAEGEMGLGSRVGVWDTPLPIRVQIETRPYSWVEFSNVHYDPDRARWPQGYWGKAGEKAVVRRGDIALRAILVPTSEGLARVYAPDARIWRNAPNVREYASRHVAPTDGGKPILFAEFGASPSRPKVQGWAEVRTFASEASRPGRGLGEALDAKDGGFRRPGTPYVQFQVFEPLPWRKVGEISPPTKEQIDLLAKQTEGAASQWPSLWVIAEAVGHADVPGIRSFLSPRMNLVRWKVREPGTRASVVVRTRDGVRHRAQGLAIPGLFYARHTEALFTPDGKGDVVFRTWEGLPSKEKTISLRDVAAFEIEIQDYAKPLVLVAKVPPAREP